MSNRYGELSREEAAQVLADSQKPGFDGSQYSWSSEGKLVHNPYANRFPTQQGAANQHSMPQYQTSGSGVLGESFFRSLYHGNMDADAVFGDGGYEVTGAARDEDDVGFHGV